MSRDLPPRPGFSFPGPVPREALEYFRGKDLRPGFSYLDVWGQEHAHAFTVAKALQLDVLDDLRDGVERAIAEGRTYRQFAGELTPLLQKRDGGASASNSIRSPASAASSSSAARAGCAPSTGPT